jgi:MFS family permease
VPTPLRRNRDFQLLWSGGAVSELGTSLTELALPLVGYAITGSTTQAALASAGFLAGRLVLTLPAGAYADRHDRRRIVVTANLAAAVPFAVLAVVVLAGGAGLALLIGCATLVGALSAYVSPAVSGAVRTVVPPEQLPVASSQNQARGHAVALVGPPLGGALYAVSSAVPFAVDAASYLAAAGLLSFVRTPLRPPAREPSTVRADVLEGLRFLWREPVIRSTMIWGGLINFSAALVLFLVTLRLVRAGVAPVAIGSIDSIAAVAGLLGALVAPRIIRAVPSGLLTIGTGLLVAIVLVPTAFTDRVWLIGLFLGLGCLMLPANNAAISSFMVSRVPHGLQGRVMAAGGLIAEGLLPLSPLLAGVLLAGLSARDASLLGVACVALSLVPLLLTREIRGLGRPDQWPAAVD